jgi:hypothetical protein
MTNGFMGKNVGRGPSISSTRFATAHVFSQPFSEDLSRRRKSLEMLPAAIHQNWLAFTYDKRMTDPQY